MARRSLLRRIAGFSFALGTALALSDAAAAQEATPRPNILVIVADDLGWSDLGAFGGEISTPNLDAIALGGLRLTGFHTAPTCSPTRAMLLSGTDNHLAGLGTMAEMQAANQRGRPNYEGYLRADVATVAERLESGGYLTLFSGKWHLGLTPEQDPHARGFQHSFALLQGGHNHFGTDLTVEPRPGGGATYRENGVVVSQLPANFYSSDAFAGRLVDFLAHRTPQERAQPFFAYLAFTAPHWPLQAPAEDIARYRGRYDEGFEVIRARRLARQEQLGLIAPGTAAHPVRQPEGDWDALTADQRRTAARNMEIYAAMVDRLDQNVGRVLAELRRTGELDNTIILFLADNGAEALDIDSPEGRAFFSRFSGRTWDNSFDNRGTASSYVTYGRGWAEAATAPSWLVKAYATEGGTRTVAFLSGPGVPGGGAISNAFLSVADVSPTLLDYAGVDAGRTQVGGRAVRPITGRSWRPLLNGTAARIYGENDGIGTELFGSRAYRQGDWKITDIGDGQWHLFNIAADPGETRDLSAEQPDRLRALIAGWDRYAAEVGVILPDSFGSYRP